MGVRENADVLLWVPSRHRPRSGLAKPGTPLILEVMSAPVTQLLQSVEQGDPTATEELLPLVYDELRKLAAWRLAAEPPGQTLQTTALVHEAWIRLTAGQEQKWRCRTYFFAAAAEAMRRILIERARRKVAARKAGFAERDVLRESRFGLNGSSPDLLAVHEALSLLEGEDAQAAELVKLRYFVGMSMIESAEAMGISVRSAERLWTFCKAFLKNALSEGQAESR